jgi:2-C-methyl-D-erythritol 4-phosphate cytidylyltransferase
MRRGPAIVIIPAAGKGERLAGETPKQFMTLGDRPVLAWSLAAAAAAAAILEVIVGAAQDQVSRAQAIVSAWYPDRPCRVIAGGRDRQETVSRCLEAAPDSPLVLIHDAARPFLTVNLMEIVLYAAEKHRAATVAIPPVDTVKLVSREGGLAENLARARLRLIQTPQAFEGNLIREAHRRAEQDGFRGTDDTALVERLGVPVEIAPGSSLNLKITTPADWEIAKALVASGLVSPAAPRRA